MSQQKLPLIERFVVAFAMIAAVGTVAGCAGKLWWVCETISCFRVHYFLGLSAASVLSLRRRSYLPGGVFVLLAVVNLFSFGHYYFPQARMNEATNSLRLASINVHTGNPHWELVVDFISSFSPDIVLLTEVNQDWLTRLQVLEKDYAYHVSKSREDNFGIALFSKVAPDRLEILNLVAGEIPSILMTFSSGSSTCTLVGTHPLPPRNREYSIVRNLQLRELSAFFQKVRGEKILLGDLNTPPWSGYFHDLLTGAGLKDSAKGFGISVTWPVQAWVLFGIPIDHCLLSPALQVHERQVGPAVGSDHYPILVDIGIP